MRLDRTRNLWNRSIEKLRAQWITFTNGIVRAVANELMKIRQEEIKQQFRANMQRAQSRESSRQ
jgi:hypothetical protein